MRKVLVVAGPTASGKSGLALELADRLDGTVINADAMQVYGVLRVLTARPGPSEEARAPHRLYGVLDPAEVCSAGRWRAMAAQACEESWAAGRLPIVVGGTGLYIRSLVDGLSPMPDIPAEVRAATRARFAELGNEAFHRMLADADPVMAARLHQGNSQRLMRAWEVLAATGRSLAEWQKAEPVGGLDADAFTILLQPPREQLYANCDRRFLAMLDEGALEEVRSLMDRALDADLPAMKALGVPELIAFLGGRMGRAAAIADAQQATRNYAKRQVTWFRHQLDAQLVLSAKFSESFSPETFSKIRDFLLTRR